MSGHLAAGCTFGRKHARVLAFPASSVRKEIGPQTVALVGNVKIVLFSFNITSFLWQLELYPMWVLFLLGLSPELLCGLTVFIGLFSRSRGHCKDEMRKCVCSTWHKAKHILHAQETRATIVLAPAVLISSRDGACLTHMKWARRILRMLGH